jgi:prephenate dehydratase
MKIGIQGGQGSFNHQAILKYLNDNSISDYEIVFLFTTENVLKALESGEIDYGQFAIHNSLGGMVNETLDCIGRFKFKVKAIYKIQIVHNLMMRKDATFPSIKTFMAHPQVFKQCENTLKSDYPNIELRVGEGDLIDHAKVAECLSKNEIDRNIAVIGPSALAAIYNLEIVRENLQDKSDNFTTFLLVE